MLLSNCLFGINLIGLQRMLLEGIHSSMAPVEVRGLTLKRVGPKVVMRGVGISEIFLKALGSMLGSATLSYEQEPPLWPC